MLEDSQHVCKAMPAELKETKDGAEISYVYRLFDVAENIPGNECRVTYGIRKDGALTIHMEYEADEKIKTHEMPGIWYAASNPGAI